MEVYTRNIGNIFLNGGNIHYVLPHFQRPYAWDDQNWKTLLDDVFEIYSVSADGVIHEHFMGALVVVNEGTYQMIPRYKLVDGQQRLTTISLLLRAYLMVMGDLVPELTHEVEALLVNRRQSGALRYKVLPTLKRNDRAIYQAVIDGQPTGETDSLIDDAYSTLCEELERRIAMLGEEFDWERLYSVITQGLYVVFIEIKQTERPFEIFESLNAKGKPLTQTDLVRNYIAMRLPLNEQENAFDQYWAQIDHLLDDERTVARFGEMTAFLRHYLAMDSGQLYNEDAIYQRFRERMERRFKLHEDFITELQTLRRFAHIYDTLLRPENEPDARLRHALERLNVFESATAFPVLMYVFDAFHRGEMTRDSLIEGLKVIENYLVRRALVGETTFSNRMFPSIVKAISLHDLSASLRSLLSRQRYISDARLRETLLTRRVYASNSQLRIRFLLEEVNRHLSEGTGGFTVLDGSATIEHIMPQSLTSEWRQILGPEAEKIHADYVHTLGNLTLVNQSWNSSMSNSSFEVKHSILRSNALKLNQSYFSIEFATWSADEVRARSNWLVEHIIWLWPSLSDISSSADTESFTNTSPTALFVRGEKIDVSSWRDVNRFMAQLAWDEKADFESLASITLNVARREAGTRWFKLPEMWAVYLNLDANGHMGLCRTLATSIGLHEGIDWWVEVERY